MNKTEQDIGFVIPKLEHNPLCNKIMDCINKFIANNPNNQYIIFKLKPRMSSPARQRSDGSKDAYVGSTQLKLDFQIISAKSGQQT